VTNKLWEKPPARSVVVVSASPSVRWAKVVALIPRCYEKWEDATGRSSSGGSARDGRNLPIRRRGGKVGSACKNKRDEEAKLLSVTTSNVK